MFQIGDRVRCININNIDSTPGIPPPLVLGREYIIYDINVHDCGAISLDVGIPTNKDESNCRCGRTYLNKGVHWCSSKRFIKVQEKTEYKVIHSEIEVEEPVLN